jgi:hypothetical protein
MANVTNLFEKARQSIDEADQKADAIERGASNAHTQSVSDERLAKLEGAYDALKVVRPLTVAVMAVFVAVMLGGFAFLGFQNAQLSTKLEGIPQALREEFRALRAEMAAQTSAIANSITATKQAQQPTPPAPPQIIVIPPGASPAQLPTPKG